MRSNISFVIRLAVLLAIPVLAQYAGSKYLAHRAKAAQDAELEKEYALLRDGDGTSRGPRAETLQGLEAAMAASGSNSVWPDDSVASSESIPKRPALLMRYLGPGMEHGKRDRTSVTELPRGTSVMFIDGQLQLYHPLAKSDQCP
jgi:hypothetical protein